MTLYLVSTPIGNLEDITLRSIRVLKEVDFVIAEDTREARKLLQHLEIKKKETVSYHSHSDNSRKKWIIKRLLDGESAALTTDRGSPGISDPGAEVVSLAIENGVDVVPLPGPTALIPALQLSCFPIARFVFAGFPPAKKGRNKFFESFANEDKPIVLYESPHRLKRTIEQMAEVFGKDRRVAVSAEITKVFERTFRGTLGEVLEVMKSVKLKGEFVVVVDVKKKKL